MVTLRVYECAKCKLPCEVLEQRWRRRFGFVIETRSACCNAPVKTTHAQEVDVAALDAR